ncbi:MAG: DegV family EDD domain-containing protein [Polyangiaceae bacterium]|nr:DegV family EDD domain-containing protein [Polyangiaceae bacterium]
MIVVTNPGSNLPTSLVEAYGIEVTPQQIIVDGVAHDTRDGVSFDQIDKWVKTAKEHPYVLGTNAGEFAALFARLAQRDKDILAVMTSRKIIGSFNGAQVASRTVSERHPDVHITVADCGVTDLGAGLACILAAEARDAGLDATQIAELIDTFREHVRFVVVPKTLDYIVKGGRASSMRAFFAELFGVRPLVAFVDGEIRAVGKASAKGDPTTAISDWLVQNVGPKRPAWVGVFHGGSPAVAAILQKELRSRFDVRYCLSRPLAPSIYLHAGPEAIGAVVVPLDALPWQPTKVLADGD